MTNATTDKPAVNDDMIIVRTYSNSHDNDRQEFIPTNESVSQGLSDEISTAVADTSYFSEKNIADCEQMKIEPIISMSKEKHNRF